MKIYTITSHVADQVAALEARCARRRQILRPVSNGLVVLTVLGVIYGLAAGRTQLAVALAGAGLVGLLLLGVLAVAGPNKRDVAIKRAGAAGEAVLPQLLAELPDSFTLLNGVPVPGSRADIDHVLVGPSGIWAIEAKHHVGMVQCVGDAWGYARLGARGVPQQGHIGNPSQQARRAADALERYLRLKGVEQPVQPLVVFTHPRVELSVEQPTVPIVRAAEVAELFTGQPSRLPPQARQRVVVTLRKLRPLKA